MSTGPLARRASGILLHPTALPSAHGIGDLGAAAREFVDFLATAGQKIWQVLPLGPPGGGASPYQSPSSHAGNPMLIDPYAEFMALKDAHGGASWTDWRSDQPDPERVRIHRAIQFQFFRQWQGLKD